MKPALVVRPALVSVVVALSLLVAPAPMEAQQSPFLPDATYRALAGEISGDIAFEHVRWFTHHHRPMGGGEGFEAVARYVEEKARAYGLEDVRYIKLRSNQPSWSPRPSELWLTAPVERRLAFSQEIPLSLADYSRPARFADVALVDVGEGTEERDYAGREVTGKVVLTSGPVGRVMEEAVWKRGARGLVVFSTGRTDFPDQYPWMRVPVENADRSKRGTFAFVLTQREGLRLRRELAEAKGGGFTVSGRVDSVFHEPASQAIVEGVIRGTAIHDRDIVLTAHLQEEMFSANDDASGCASVLEIARALAKAIDEGRLPRPRRDIRFWWLDEISASEQYFADHPEERRQLLANINQDMVGAKQSVGSRVQFVTRPPASRASFLGDVVASIVESLVEGNTAYLAAGQARQVRRGVARPAADGGEDLPFSRPLVARLGTRERYDARVVPFHNNTDHQVFNMGIVGVPGVTFTNWPDDYIHSSGDDLWQIDPTQLRRNAVAVAAAAYYLAAFDDDDLPALLGEMSGRGSARIARDTATALGLIAAAPADERALARVRAVNLVREAARREQRALQSVARLAPGEAARIDAAAVVFDDRAATARLSDLVRAIHGAPLAEVSELPTAMAAGGKVPILVDDVQGFLDRRDRVNRPPNLHNLMMFEVLNFVDGERTYQDIHRAVAAEADAAGDWYYGTVALDDVVAVLDAAVEAGILRLK